MRADSIGMRTWDGMGMAIKLHLCNPCDLIVL
jgi:hypothetical protein